MRHGTRTAPYNLSARSVATSSHTPLLHYGGRRRVSFADGGSVKAGRVHNGIAAMCGYKFAAVFELQVAGAVGIRLTRALRFAM